MTLFYNRNAEAPRKKMGCGMKILICVVAYFALTGLFYWFNNANSYTHLEDHSVYKLTLKGELLERAQEDDPFALIKSQLYGMGDNETVGLNTLLENISKAKNNKKIDGIYLYGGSLSMGPASAKALRDALLDFKQSGKWIIAYADSYGTFNYYIASVADKIYLNPVGGVQWHGAVASKMYYTRLLQKVGVEMQIVKVGTFKSAVEPYFRTSMSEADKQQTMQYISGLWNDVVDSVAVSRGISADQLNALADQFMDLQPQEKYTQSGLVDELVYPYDMDSILRARVSTEEVAYVSTAAMSNVKSDSPSASDKIAVLYAVGEITDEQGDGIVGKDMLKTIAKIKKNDDIKALVLRVNSPGGSANASEQIWYALQTLKQQGLPVVVSMGDYAASGGYYISCGADYIFAQPTTLTGSIGIFGLIPNAGELRNKVGLDIDGIGTNKLSMLAADLGKRPMNKEEYALMQTMVERGYDLFTTRCAQGRHTTQEAIKAVGEGRVWLGKDALSIGLVDSLGNIQDAINKAAELAQLTKYETADYPAQKDFVTELMESLDNTTEEEKLFLRLKALCSKPRIMALSDQVTIQ